MKSILNQIFCNDKNKNFYSQEGEDYFLNILIQPKKEGFFVDIGSAHPIRANNTYFFYLKGWRGICIDAAPSLNDIYKKYRPNDLFINAFIGNKTGYQKFYIFNEPFLNTGSKKRKEIILKNTSYKLQKTVSVIKRPLREILDKYLPVGKEIEIMSCDIEDSELDALRSNNWKLYMPKIVVLEVLHQDRGKIGDKASVKFLQKIGYKIIAILPRSVFFSLT